MPSDRPSASSNGDFLKLWAAESISLIGTRITDLAIPLLAVTLLNASALQMGFINLLREAPYPIFSLLAGAWLDHAYRRPVLIVSDLARAVVLSSIPLGWLAGWVSLPQLYIAVFLLNTCTVFFEVAHYAYVPTLVLRKQLVAANSKLQVSHSVAELGGPGAAGLLIQVVSAPFAIVVDVVSYLGSALLLGSIRNLEPKPKPRAHHTSIWSDIREGLQTLLGLPELRAIIIASIFIAIFNSGLNAIYVLYLVRNLGLTPGTIGLIFAAGGTAAVAGAFSAQWAAKRIGVGHAIISGWWIEMAAWLLVPLAAGLGTVWILLAVHVIGGGAGTIANIHQWSYRQNAVSDHMLARVTAGHRFIVFGSSALGALLGGVLGNWLGLRSALWICGLGALLGPLYASFSPLRKVQVQPKGE